jgi:hypothetical protein
MQDRYREQARSYSGFSAYTKPVFDSDQNVGASLLAMASAQPPAMLNAPLLSRASSLLQWFFRVHKNLCSTVIKM